MRTDKYTAGTRLFAFLAVSCCIVAVAWASREPLLVAIGVPGLAVGHLYSWWQRNSVSWLRTLILLVLIILLTLYLGEEVLLSGISDRVLLSQYIVCGLVLGSFDLMRKRNLMASVILGGLLLMLITELALNLWFVAFPVAFMLLASTSIAVSRIGTEASGAVPVGEFRWFTGGKTWLAFAACTLLLSGVLFLFIPRIAAGQVTQANWLPTRIDLGLGGFSLLPGKPGASPWPGILPSLQDDGSLYGGEHAVLGYIGSLADEPVMHVRSQVSSYWRGLTMDRYDGRGWLSSSPELSLLDEGRREFVFPDSRRDFFGEGVYWQAYYLLADQPDAVFTGYSPGRVYLPYIEHNFLESGTVYRALSVVPNVRPELLRIDRAAHDDINYLVLPPLTGRTVNLVESIVEGAATDYDKAARLERFLLNNYPYDLTVEPVPAGRDAVDYFLFEQQAGYCAHFATAMAVMARQAGLPARVAAGYLPGVIDTMTGAHIVRVGDAHAWVEVHFKRHGWVAFDPTPGLDIARGFTTRRGLVYFGLEEFTGVSFTGMVSPLFKGFSTVKLSMSLWLWVVLCGAAAAGTVLALLLRRRRAGDRQDKIEYSRLAGEPRSAVLALYYKMVSMLAGKGLPCRQPHQPPSEYAALITTRIPHIQEIVGWLTRAASSAAYDPGYFDPSIAEEARGKLSALRRALAGRRSGQ